MEKRKIGKYLVLVTDGSVQYIENRKGEHLGDIGIRWKKPVISIGDLDFDAECLRDIAGFLEGLA